MMSEGAHAKKSLRWAVGLAIAVGAIYALTTARSPPPSNPVASMTAEVSPADRRDQHFDVAVPKDTPANPISVREETVHQGDVVEFTVTSPRSGAVVVHGLLEPRTVVADARVTVAFRAIYTGRFPLHFHGADGSHFEIVAVNVLPAVSGSGHEK